MYDIVGPSGNDAATKYSGTKAVFRDRMMIGGPAAKMIGGGATGRRDKDYGISNSGSPMPDRNT